MRNFVKVCCHKADLQTSFYFTLGWAIKVHVHQNKTIGLINFVWKVLLWALFISDWTFVTITCPFNITIHIFMRFTREFHCSVILNLNKSCNVEDVFFLEVVLIFCWLNSGETSWSKLVSIWEFRRFRFFSIWQSQLNLLHTCLN